MIANKNNDVNIFRNLRIFNLIMGFLHTIQGLLMFIISNDFNLPVNTSFVKYSPQLGKLITVPENVFDIKIGPMVAGFLFLSAIAHFFVSLPGIYSWYVSNLKKGANYARWIEYSLSSSLMIVVIAMLAGMYDGVSLILIFSINSMMILFGWMMELHNQSTKKTDWTSFIFGIIAGIIPWIAIAIYLYGAGEGNQKPPDFVYIIFFTIFLFFNVFAINMFLQYKKIGPWKNYLFGERSYIILSLIAKTLLAWQVWAGTLRPV